MDAARHISELRKAGRLDEALEVAKPALAAASDDLWLNRASGWLFYELIKRDINAFEEGRISRGELIAHLDAWLRQYARGGQADCPGLLHSLMLTLVVKVDREWPRFLAFARWWDPRFLRTEDREGFKLDNGKTVASLEMRFVYAVARAISASPGEQSPDLIAWGSHLLDTTLQSHPNDQWLHYYKSKQLTDLGRASEAREHLLPVLRRQRQASWAWALFGATWKTDDPANAITCYFRALQVARKDVEVLATRVHLAELLARAERYAEAAAQVRAALECREANGYRIPQNLSQLADSDWYRRYSALPNVIREPDVSKAAEELLFGADASDLKYRLGVIDNQNKDKALAHVVFDADAGAILLYRTMKGISDLAVGTCVEVGFVNGENHPVAFRQSEKTTIPGVCGWFEGEFSQRPGQAFAFIVTHDGERIFVHPSLVGEHRSAAGDKLSCHAVIGKDKQGKPGWRAVSIEQRDAIECGSQFA
ncbi:tetratricopeptide repeat protein [Thiocapsa sp. UBA6158]|jgi:tetratricopeptide (TPR) repeat protein/cold shock CspA family protein|uniref:tetratricopeptide repeat protein n=1 Tax=Thiocapsa sp. UBA6158 TaxID=1947692 RepID=UPI0025FE14B1|nr:hypothetical protein [Thiocapsa sp. UBA6158]